MLDRNATSYRPGDGAVNNEDYYDKSESCHSLSAAQAQQTKQVTSQDISTISADTNSDILYAINRGDSVINRQLEEKEKKRQRRQRRNNEEAANKYIGRRRLLSIIERILAPLLVRLKSSIVHLALYCLRSLSIWSSGNWQGTAVINGRSSIRIKSDSSSSADRSTNQGRRSIWKPNIMAASDTGSANGLANNNCSLINARGSRFKIADNEADRTNIKQQQLVDGLDLNVDATSKLALSSPVATESKTTEFEKEQQVAQTLSELLLSEALDKVRELSHSPPAPDSLSWQTTRLTKVISTNTQDGGFDETMSSVATADTTKTETGEHEADTCLQQDYGVTSKSMLTADESIVAEEQQITEKLEEKRETRGMSDTREKPTDGGELSLQYESDELQMDKDDDQITENQGKHSLADKQTESNVGQIAENDKLDEKLGDFTLQETDQYVDQSSATIESTLILENCSSASSDSSVRVAPSDSHPENDDELILTEESDGFVVDCSDDICGDEFCGESASNSTLRRLKLDTFEDVLVCERNKDSMNAARRLFDSLDRATGINEQHNATGRQTSKTMPRGFSKWSRGSVTTDGSETGSSCASERSSSPTATTTDQQQQPRGSQLTKQQKIDDIYDVKLVQRAPSSASSIGGSCNTNFGLTLVCSVSPTNQLDQHGASDVSSVHASTDPQLLYPIDGEEIRQCRAAFRENKRLIEKHQERASSECRSRNNLDSNAPSETMTGKNYNGRSKSRNLMMVEQQQVQMTCSRCMKRVYPVDKMELDFTKTTLNIHRNCFKCQVCSSLLRLETYASIDAKLYCPAHVKCITPAR